MDDEGSRLQKQKELTWNDTWSDATRMLWKPSTPTGCYSESNGVAEDCPEVLEMEHEEAASDEASVRQE